MLSAHALVPHPDCAPGPLSALTVTVAPAKAGLRLDYRLSGAAEALALPEPGPALRRDGLWRHTCCELFVQGDDAPAYREFNFSPAGPWQAYAFPAYRQGGPLTPALAPSIGAAARADGLTVSVCLPWANLPPGRKLCLGLTAVVEAADGGIAYWALAHPAGKPDFHHPDTFALTLDLHHPTP